MKICEKIQGKELTNKYDQSYGAKRIVSEIKQNNFKSQKLFLAVETPNILPGLVVLESTVCEEEGHGFCKLYSFSCVV